MTCYELATLWPPYVPHAFMLQIDSDDEFGLRRMVRLS